MTQQQEQFLFRAMVRREKYPDIATAMNVDRKQLTAWWDELKDERLKLAPLVQLWTRKCEKVEFGDFRKWFEQTERSCFYCGIAEAEIKLLIENGKIHTKRLSTRGRTLEIDRKLPNENYDKIDNLVFCCYWCNNAKTDEFTVEEFKPVAEAIGKVWKTRLNK